jgi:hypothetical protein
MNEVEEREYAVFLEENTKEELIADVKQLQEEIKCLWREIEHLRRELRNEN